MTRTSMICLLVVTSASLSRADAPKTASRRVTIAITQDGFDPDKIRVAAEQPITLVITRQTDQTCAKRVVIEIGDGKKIAKDLPLGKSIEIATTFARRGELRYACAMDMLSGVIVVQ